MDLKVCIIFIELSKKDQVLLPKHFQNKQFANSGSVYTPERHFSLDRLTQQAEFSGIIDFIDGEIRFHGNTDHLSTLLGYPAQQLRDEPFINFVSPKDLQKATDGVKLILSNKNILDLSINLIHQNGSDIPVEFSALLKGKKLVLVYKAKLVANNIDLRIPTKISCPFAANLLFNAFINSKTDIF